MALTKDKVRETPTFKTLDGVQQKLILNKDKYELISNGFNVTAHRGLGYWKNAFFPQDRIFKIVKELHWKTPQEIPPVNKFILFTVIRVFRVDGKTEERVIEILGYYEDDVFFGENTHFPPRNVINWQLYYI